MDQIAAQTQPTHAGKSMTPWLTRAASLSWKLFLLGWMHGMALFNALWIVAMLASIPLWREGWQRARKAQWPRMLLWSLLGYEATRWLGALVAAPNGMEALRGVYDDLRMLGIFWLAWLHLRSRNDLIQAAWLSWLGFSILAWWALGLHWIRHHNLSMAISVTYGTFGHVNYAAAWSGSILLISFWSAPFLSWRQRAVLLAGWIPMLVLMAPLGSRTTIIAMSLGALGMALLHPKRKKPMILSAAFLLLALIGILAWTHNTAQFRVFEHFTHAGSFTVRADLFRLSIRIAKDHPLGLGPRGHGFLDLHPYRTWIEHQAPALFRYHYQNHWSDTAISPLYDPHSQYANTLLEGGWLGLGFLLALWASIAFFAFRLLKSKHTISQAIAGALLVIVWMYASCGTTVMVMHQAGGAILFGLLAAGVAAYQGKLRR